MAAEIVNLRRIKKAKARVEKSTAADANRVKHGVSKSARDLAQTRSEKEEKVLAAHLLDDHDK